MHYDTIYRYVTYIECCMYIRTYSLVPGVVDITDVTCDVVNLINRCTVRWNVSVIVTCVIGLIVGMYVCTWKYLYVRDASVLPVKLFA